MIIKIFSPKSLAKISVFLTQNKASFCKNCDHNIFLSPEPLWTWSLHESNDEPDRGRKNITLVYEKNANFLAENG
jgi:hypothetical protein